jgi:hypothetical protein
MQNLPLTSKQSILSWAYAIRTQIKQHCLNSRVTPDLNLEWPICKGTHLKDTGIFDTELLIQKRYLAHKVHAIRNLHKDVILRISFKHAH